MSWNYVKYRYSTHSLTMKWAGVFVCLTGISLFCVFEMKDLQAATGLSINLYDIIFYQFGLYSNLYLLLFPLYLILISDLAVDHRMDYYMYTRVMQHTVVWRSIVITIALSTLTFVATAMIVALIVGIAAVPFSNQWSELMQYTDHPTGMIEFQTTNFKEFSSWGPALTLAVHYLFLYAYMLTMGIAVNIISLRSRRPFYGFAAGMMYNFVMLMGYKFHYELTNYALFPFQKLMLQFQESSMNILNVHSVAFSILYWIVVVLVSYFISLKICFNNELIYEVKTYD